MTSTVEAKKIAALQSFRTFLPAGPQSFRVEITRKLDGVLRWAHSPAGFAATGQVVVSYDATMGPAHIELAMNRLSGHGKEIDRAMGGSKSSDPASVRASPWSGKIKTSGRESILVFVKFAARSILPLFHGTRFGGQIT